MARIMSPISFSAVKASALELGSETVGLASASLSQRDWTCDSERPAGVRIRSEEHTSELQSQSNLVCRLLLEKKKRHQRQCRTDDAPSLRSIMPAGKSITNRGDWVGRPVYRCIASQEPFEHVQRAALRPTRHT